MTVIELKIPCLGHCYLLPWTLECREYCLTVKWAMKQLKGGQQVSVLES